MAQHSKPTPYQRTIDRFSLSRARIVRLRWRPATVRGLGQVCTPNMSTVLQRLNVMRKRKTSCGGFATLACATSVK